MARACLIVIVVTVVTWALILAGGVRRAAGQPAAARSAPPRAIEPAQAAIEPRTLQEMYRLELGALYRPEMAEKLREAHGLMETYFGTREPEQKKAIVTKLEESGLDPNVLGRIARIRTYWPKLEGGTYYINERVGPHVVIYFLGIPKGYDRARPWPMLVKLPGAHVFVTDPPPTAEQVVQVYTRWVEEELEKHPDAVVLMPLLDLKELWGPSYKGMNSVYQPLLHAAGRVNIDPARVYMLGHGMSGHSTWNLALHYPTYFTAIAPMSGGASAGWQRLRMKSLRNILCVVWHDADDPVVKVDSSRQLVRMLQQLRYDVDYEETKNVGHAPSEQIAERVYQKMRRRARELYPQQVVHGSNRPDAIFNRNDWVHVYQMLTPGQERKAFLAHGSGTIMFMDNQYQITATIKAPNRIEVVSGNVESMRFYLNDQMVDFSRPIMVTVNGPARFEGMVKPSVETMLGDQMFLGRGWRYFTGFIDIDFGERN